MTRTVTATYVHNMKYFDTTDISAINLEPLIDQAIDTVNARAGLDIAHLSGTAGTKSASMEDAEAATVTILSVILALNAVLSNESTRWNIERRNNAIEMVSGQGFLTVEYENLITALQTTAETGTSSQTPRARAM